MARERIQIQKESFRRDQMQVALDTEFQTFTTPVEQDTDTVENFFRLYDKLFYSIPTQGEVNSHEYLLQRSSQLADFEKDLTEIQPILDEIAQLRQQLLNANQQIFDLENRE